MAMIRSLKQLELECKGRNISLPVEKYGKRELVNLLAKKSLEARPYSKNLEMRMSLESPMLCFAHWNLKPAEQRNLETDPNWVVEEKIDGCRCMIVYSPEEGFSFYSRNVEVVNYLPNDLTENILLIKNGQVSKPKDWVGKFKQSFMLDSEVVVSGNIDTSLYRKTGVETGTELNAVTALLAINSADAHDIQLTQAQVSFVVFDMVLLGEEEIWKLPLRSRRQLLDRVVGQLSQSLPFRINPQINEGKEAFFQEILAKGGEGVVYKNIHQPYITTESRPRTHQIKRKRRVTENGQDDIDCFITGFTDATEGKQWSEMGLIGGLKMSVFLDDGEEHWIATVSSMPLEIRTALSEVVDGKPRLKQEFYGRVLVCSGQDISAKALRFSHATCDWSRGFRSDKSALDCKMTREELTAQVL